jgi:hypothetical protein
VTLEELERSITHLPPDELERFRQWFLDFDAENWDHQMESDMAAGHLDSLADSAISEHRAGESDDL